MNKSKRQPEKTGSSNKGEGNCELCTPVQLNKLDPEAGTGEIVYKVNKIIEIINKLSKI